MASAADMEQRRREIAVRLAVLGAEMARLREEYRSLVSYERLTPHLSLQVGDRRVLLPAEEVEETVAMVKVTPTPDCRPPVVGTFQHRGVVTTAVDGGLLLGGGRTTRGEFIVVLAGSPRTALLVQSTQGVVSGLDVTYDKVGDGQEGSGLVGALARDQAGVVLVLNPEAVRRIVRGGQL